MNTERIKVIAYNAIVMLEEVNCNQVHEELLEELGITEEEYKEITEVQ